MTLLLTWVDLDVKLFAPTCVVMRWLVEVVVVVGALGVNSLAAGGVWRRTVSARLSNQFKQD